MPLEVPEPLHAVAAATGVDPVSFVLAGGEDHSLLATFPEGAVAERLDGHRLGRRGRGRHRRRRGVRRRDRLDALLETTSRNNKAAIPSGDDGLGRDELSG